MKLDIQLFGGRGQTSKGKRTKQTKKTTSNAQRRSVREALQQRLNAIRWVNENTKITFYDNDNKKLKGDRYEYKKLKTTKMSMINAPSNADYLNMTHDTITYNPQSNEINIYAKKKKGE